MKKVTFFILLHICLLTYSQKNKLKDTDYLRLQDKARSYLYIDIDSAYYFASQIEKSSNHIHQSFANGIKGYIFQLKNDTLNSKKHLNSAYDLLKYIPDSKEKRMTTSYLLNYDGLIEWKKNNLTIALKKYQEGKKIAESINDIVQTVKFNANIGLINKNIKNYDIAITTFKKSLLLVNQNFEVFPKEEINSMISNIHLNISNCYERKFQEKKDIKKIDSALYHTQKALQYTRNNGLLKMRSLTSLGNIYFLKDDYTNSKKAYQSALIIAKEIGMLADYNTLLCNLGHINYYYKKEKEALVYFTKVDSLYQAEESNLTEEYVLSNYYLAKIYNILGKNEEASKYSKKYLENYEAMAVKEIKETLDINNTLNNQKLQEEMIQINKQHQKEKIIKITTWVIILSLLLFLLFYFRKKNKLRIQQVKQTAEKFQLEIEKTKSKNIALQNEIEDFKKEKKPKNTVTIDSEKEEQIVTMLLALEKKEVFLNHDFTQPFVAKKIKTNTAYLSHVVNKRFGKTFSEYANDLKINYAIHQMKTNPIYRKYNTQAIAESVGFKSAVSFRKSFNKKTGLSPTQFLKQIEEEQNK
ncbi:helix-turn-helix domain-containing protein [Flavobacterium sp. J27]|uniref:helix-turn-helix domain-containing protein n=1 Tax=Flavobacterium sp. J27 TaxID=2060419 RepID=UPI001030D488|nr:helix-turn-helix domain-containing protein [Flavobacterium sp. J27]